MALAAHYEEGETCSCCALYKRLNAKDKAFFNSKADGPVSWLWQACVKGGWDVSETRFRVHMRNHHGS